MGRRKTEKEYIGKIYENKYGTLFKIVSYTNYQNVDCLDITHNIILKNVGVGNLVKGHIISPLDKSLYIMLVILELGNTDKKIIKNVIQHGIILFVVAIQKNIKQNIALMKNVVYAKNGIIIKILLNGFAKIIMKLLKKEWK